MLGQNSTAEADKCWIRGDRGICAAESGDTSRPQRGRQWPPAPAVDPEDTRGDGIGGELGDLEPAAAAGGVEVSQGGEHAGGVDKWETPAPAGGNSYKNSQDPAAGGGVGLRRARGRGRRGGVEVSQGGDP
jgi:hypothetical protein